MFAHAVCVMTLAALRTMSDKHTISYPNNLLSSPHSGVLIAEESTFNFSLSRLAMPSCPSDPLFSASWNILENDRDLHADTKIERVSGCAFNTSTPRGIWFDEFLSWKLQGSYAFGTFSNNHSFCHLNLINLLCRMKFVVDHLNRCTKKGIFSHRTEEGHFTSSDISTTGSNVFLSFSSTFSFLDKSWSFFLEYLAENPPWNAQSLVWGILSRKHTVCF